MKSFFIKGAQSGMFDDVKLSGYLDDYYSWKQINKGKIKRPYWKVFEDDGDIKTEEDDGSFTELAEEKIKWREEKNKLYRYSTIIHYTGFQTYDIQVKETLKEFHSTGRRTVSYFLTISGSIKSNHFGGTNWERFTFQDLQYQIGLLESLGLDIFRIKIDNLAPSLTIKLPFPVLGFLGDCLLSYRGNAFKPYDPDSKGKVIGYYCPLDQVEIKLYDKSLQLNLPSNLMQFEDSFSKMQRLKRDYGIEYLSDLQDFPKVSKLVDVLLNTWDDTLLYDNTIDVNESRLNDRQMEMVKWGDTSKYWEKLKKSVTSSTYGNRITEFRQLSVNYGSSFHQLIRAMIADEWDYLLKSWIELPGAKKEKLDKITSSVGGNIIQVDNHSENNNMNNQPSNINQNKIQSSPLPLQFPSIKKLMRIKKGSKINRSINRKTRLKIAE